MMNSFYLHHPASEMFHWWQIITHVFTHVSVMHLLLNVLGFVVLYKTKSFTPSKVFELLLWSIALSMASHFYHETIPLAGCSALIFAMWSYSYKNIHGPIVFSMLLPLLDLSDLLDMISHHAHFAGIYVGLLMKLIPQIYIDK